MQYMALIYGDQNRWASFSDEERTAAYALYRAFGEEAAAAGVLVGGSELAPTTDATTVRVRADETLVTDGPYAEVKEALGGYYVLECASMDEAVDWAARIPGAEHGAVEVRPVYVDPEEAAAVNYAMLIYDDDSTWVDLPEEEQTALRAAEMPKWVALFEELGKADPNVSGKELDGRTTAKVVRVRNGERIVTDGPFAETKEVVGGIFLTELPDLDEAIRLAALIPAASGHRSHRDPPGSAITAACSWRSSVSSARNGDAPSASSHASSAISSSPRTPCRMRSRRRSSAGRARVCRTRPAPGSSRPRATAPSIASAGRRCSSARPSSSGVSRSSLPRRRT